MLSNAAKHLRPGGTFVIENYVPELRRIPPGERTHVFTATPTHIGVGEYDMVNQLEISRHWWLIDGDLRTFSSSHRYVAGRIGPHRAPCRDDAAGAVGWMAAGTVHSGQP